MGDDRRCEVKRRFDLAEFLGRLVADVIIALLGSVVLMLGLNALGLAIGFLDTLVAYAGISAALGLQVGAYQIRRERQAGAK